MRTLPIDTSIAVFSDVQGNLPGLEAILQDIEARGIPVTISLGDLVGYGPSPSEVALIVRDRGIPSLMGDYDQGIGLETGDCGCACNSVTPSCPTRDPWVTPPSSTWALPPRR